MTQFAAGLRSPYDCGIFWYHYFGRCWTYVTPTFFVLAFLQFNIFRLFLNKICTLTLNTRTTVLWLFHVWSTNSTMSMDISSSNKLYLLTYVRPQEMVIMTAVKVVADLDVIPLNRIQDTILNMRSTWNVKWRENTNKNIEILQILPFWPKCNVFTSQNFYWI